jgi:hypothetical protein
MYLYEFFRQLQTALSGPEPEILTTKFYPAPGFTEHEFNQP